TYEDVRLESLTYEDVRLESLTYEDVRLESLTYEDVRLESLTYVRVSPAAGTIIGVRHSEESAFPHPRRPASMAMESEHSTEAACLLQQGALYRKRIGLERAGDGGGPIFAGLKHGAFSLYFGDAPIYHFDLEGRWQRIFADGIHYLKGLDVEVHAV